MMRWPGLVIGLLLTACATPQPPAATQVEVSTIVLPSHTGLRHTVISRVDGTLRANSSFLGLGPDHRMDPVVLPPGEHVLRIHESAGTLCADLDLNFMVKPARTYHIRDRWAGYGFAVWVEDEPGHPVFATRAHED
jgi:hypothetical protein